MPFALLVRVHAVRMVYVCASRCVLCTLTRFCVQKQKLNKFETNEEDAGTALRQFLNYLKRRITVREVHIPIPSYFRAFLYFVS